jgi:flagellar biosynthesis protein FlhB
MAEDFGNKTEAPTPRRRQEARDAGNFARSPDLVAALVLLGILLLLRNFGPNLVGAMKSVVSETLDVRSITNLNPLAAGQQVVVALGRVGRAMLPLMVGVMLIAVLANLLQTGFYYNPGKLMPNFGALNPIKGWNRIFISGQGLFQMLLNALKVSLVGFTAYSAIHGRIELIVSVQQLSFIQIFALGADVVFSIALRIGLLLLVLALLEYAYQKYRIEQQLKMSKEEVKEEMKRMEGDPAVKIRRRQVAIQRHKEWLKKEVPKADVIVTNPTHFSVALKYDSATMHAPRVIAKGSDFLALRIRELAREHGIPILERPPLARAIYRLCNVGDEIPEQFYSAVAEILAYVYELSGKAKKRLVTA